MHHYVDQRSFDTDYVEIFGNDGISGFETQQYTRDLARERQHMLAGELSRLDAGEYQNDILQHMMHMDVCTTITVNIQDSC